MRLGIYQIVFMDKIPESAACNEAVNLAKKYSNQGSAKFVNGVLVIFNPPTKKSLCLQAIKLVN